MRGSFLAIPTSRARNQQMGDREQVRDERIYVAECVGSPGKFFYSRREIGFCCRNFWELIKFFLVHIIGWDIELVFHIDILIVPLVVVKHIFVFYHVLDDCRFIFLVIFVILILDLDGEIMVSCIVFPVSVGDFLEFSRNLQA